MNLAKNHDLTEFSFHQINLVHSGQQMLNKVVLVKNSQSATWNLEIHRFRWGRLFLLHQNFRRLPKFRPSKSRKEKHECWSLFYAIACWIMASFALDWLLARAERRICICLQRRKCLQNHTNFVKYANHEVTEFWACKKWARTVLAFLSLQK